MGLIITECHTAILRDERWDGAGCRKAEQIVICGGDGGANMGWLLWV